ncbi:hypothetical protein TWF281_011099 [Arthrobotrys megalospora]
MDTVPSRLLAAQVELRHDNPFDHIDEDIERLIPREVSLRALSAEFRSQPLWTDRLVDRESVKSWLRERTLAFFDTDDTSAGKMYLWNRRDIDFLYEELENIKKYVVALKEKGEEVEPDLEGVWRVDGVLGDAERAAIADAVTQVGKEQDEEDNEQTKPGEKAEYRYSVSSQTLHGYEHTLDGYEYNYSGPDDDDSDADGEDADAPMAATWDLLDPFLFPVIYYSTLTLDNGEFESIPGAPGFRDEGVDQYFCWLPSEFKVSEDGNSTKIASYINNLSLPGHDVLMHPILENVFTKLVPAFNHVLADLADRSWCRKRCPGTNPLYCMDSDSFVHRWAPPNITAARNIHGKTLAVVTRMIEIKLTPAEPTHSSRDWHVDGMANECIVATGVYHYSHENVTDWSMCLRRRSMFSRETRPPDRSDQRDVGAVLVPENRGVVFPNMCQHCLSPFSLVDKSRSGFTKMLIFHIFDPGRSHYTTRTIPPQQPRQYERLLRHTRLGRLPEEIFQLIAQYVLGNTITSTKAEEYRGRMIRERNAMLEPLTEDWLRS